MSKGKRWALLKADVSLLTNVRVVVQVSTSVGRSRLKHSFDHSRALPAIREEFPWCTESNTCYRNNEE